MSKTIIQKSLEPGVFKTTPDLTAYLRSEIPGPGNTGEDQVFSLQSLIDQATQNGSITAIINFNDRGEYDPDATDYEQRDLVQYQNAAYFRKTNNPPLLAGSNGGGELPSKTSTQWAFLVEGSSGTGSGRSSDRIDLNGNVGLLATAPEVIRYVPDAPNHEVTLPPITVDTYKEFVLFNFDTTNAIVIKDETGVNKGSFGGATGQIRCQAFFIKDEWIVIITTQ